MDEEHPVIVGSATRTISRVLYVQNNALQYDSVLQSTRE